MKSVDFSKVQSNNLLSILIKPQKAYISCQEFDLEDFGFELGFTTLALTSESILEKCLNINTRNPLDEEADDQELRVILEFQIDEEFLTLIWSNPGETLPLAVYESMAPKAIMLDELYVYEDNISDNDNLIDHDKNVKYRKFLEKLIITN